ncbi:hypothetical protein ES702_05362 [subsurface metagenome]
MKSIKRIVIVAIFTLMLSFVAIPAVAADSGDRNFWAVVVGVDGGEAVNLDNDAQDFANVLMNVYGYPSENIVLLLNSQATKSAVISALEWLGDQEVQRDGVAIFFSTHGSVDLLHLYDDFLGDSELSSILSGFESHNILVMVLACYSGSFVDVADSIAYGIVVTATQADELGYDVIPWGNTIFAEFFVDRGMSQGLADANTDGMVSVQEAFNYAYENCADPPGAMTATHPQMVDQYEGDYFLNSPIHTPWFSNLMLAMSVVVLGYAIRTKKINLAPLSQ